MRNSKAKVSDPNKFVTCSGSRFHPLYGSKVTPKGDIILEEKGKEDLQAYINSFAESCDMSFILHQLSLGNTAVLERKQMMFGDFTDMPSNLAEMQQIFIDGEAAFNELPLETRREFDNNFRNWLFTSGSAEWNEKMQKLIPQNEVPTTEEVNEDVS